MIDTLDFFIPREECFRLGLDPRVRLIARGLRQSDPARFRTLDVRFTNHGDMIVTISAPGLLWGGSLSAEYSPQHARRLEMELSDLMTTLGVDIPVRDLQLCRIDICRNLSLSRPASALVCQAARYPAPRAEPSYWRDETALFKWGKQRSLKFYDKVLQSTGLRGGKVLRVELRLAKGRNLRHFLGGRSLGYLLDQSRSKVLEVLRKHILLVIGTIPACHAPDVDAVWKESLARAKRGTAAVFFALYQADRNQLQPVDIMEIAQLLKGRLAKDAFGKARKDLLRPIAAGPMDSIFRAEVLDRILEEPDLDVVEEGSQAI